MSEKSLENPAFSLDDFKKAAQSSSLSVMRKALDSFMNLDGENQARAAIALLASDNKDLRESVLDVCSESVVSSEDWKKVLLETVDDESTVKNASLCQSLLVIFQRCSELPKTIDAFLRICLKHTDADVRYQAYCLAELQEDESEEYLEMVREFLNSSDEDMRIVSVQALERLKPEWGLEALVKAAEKASWLEKFHILLARIHLCSAEERATVAKELSNYLNDDRFSFAAIQTLGEYGTPEEIPALLEYARSFLSEPTTRTAAAWAAAKLGSDEGLKLLKKFVSSRHGNPNYAQELLEKIEQTSG